MRNSGIIWKLCIALLLASAAITQDGKDQVGKQEIYKDPDLCPCIWYTSTTCECKKEEDKEFKCKYNCDKCTGKGDKCKCILDIQEKTGIITGQVKSPYTRTGDGVVYIKQVKDPKDEKNDKKFELPRKNPVMDQKNKVFIPHVLPILAGSTVDFPNSDDVRHSVYTPENSDNMFKLGQYPSGEVKHVKFEKPGISPLRCNVHVEMSADIIALQNPYFAMMDNKGKFKIVNVPPGKYELTFWHERIVSKTIEVEVKVKKEAEITFKELEKKEK